MLSSTAYRKSTVSTVEHREHRVKQKGRSQFSDRKRRCHGAFSLKRMSTDWSTKNAGRKRRYHGAFSLTRMSTDCSKNERAPIILVEKMNKHYVTVGMMQGGKRKSNNCMMMLDWNIKTPKTKLQVFGLLYITITSEVMQSKASYFCSFNFNWKYQKWSIFS